MPAAKDWRTYRLGARLAAVDGLVGREAAERVQRLQRALSSVVWMPAGGVPNAVATPTADAWFIGRLMLGLLCRGWPTLSSPAVEEAVLGSLDVGGLGLELTGGAAGVVGRRLAPVAPGDLPTWESAVLSALLRGDPRLEADEAVLAELCDSDTEKSFFRGELTDLFGSAIGWVELQRPFESLVREDLQGKSSEGGRVDFALELPGDTEPIRLIVELDGPHHDDRRQKAIDRDRNDRARQHGWTTLRVRTRDHQLDPDDLKALRSRVGAIKEHNAFPFTHFGATAGGAPDRMVAAATRLLLTPHAVARVQLALARSVMEGRLRLDTGEWSVAVAEREVPCAEWAVRDFLDTLANLCGLYGIPLEVQRVRLLVAREHLTEVAKVGVAEPAVGGIEVAVEPLTGARAVTKVDLAVDVAVGAHPTRRYPTDSLEDAGLEARRIVRLRTAQRQSGYEVDPWAEPRRVVVPDTVADGSAPSCERAAYEQRLIFFLQLLFRKEKFRGGQLPIIDRVLRRQDVIGLLPTGAGKSITFQLPALLSSGMALVIDPLKSLMQDQVENLGAIGIDDAIQINSDTPTQERARIEWQFARGEFRMVFISPERLQIQGFRDLLQTATGSNPVSYLVIDEAHCVSEWGHDFRTAYLNLGRIAADYCQHGGARPPFVALTGTASEAVLRDVRRELGLDAEDAGLIIRPASFDRQELHFRIDPVDVGGKLGALVKLLGETIPQELANAKVLANGSPGGLSKLTDGTWGGLVFCPHVNNLLGVLNVRNWVVLKLPQFRGDQKQPILGTFLNDLRERRHKVGIYSGDPPRDLGLRGVAGDQAWSELKRETQQAFKRDELSLLVVTSAFGMGIDKPNIRYTIHYIMPPSPEAFAQEAGRAGRDRMYSVCAVMFSDRLANEPVDADCLAPGIAVEEAKLRADAVPWGEGDDAERQMFLHTNGYVGIRLESLAVRGFFKERLRNKLDRLTNSDQSQTSTVVNACGDFGDGWSARYARLLGEADWIAPSIGEDPDDLADEATPSFQRVIYRLSLLGIVDDYTINYAGGVAKGDVYTLRLRKVTDEQIVENLRAYVRRYRNDDLFAPVQARMDASPLTSVVDKAIDALVWFIYEQIEQRKRQAMHTMRQMLRDSLNDTIETEDEAARAAWEQSTPGERLAKQLASYLGFGALTEQVFNVVKASERDEARWWELAERMTDADAAERVRLQVLRGLDEAPDHPGLRILGALGGLASGRGSDNVVEGLAVGLRHAVAGRSGDEYERLVRKTVAEAYDKAPIRADRLMRDLLRRVTADDTPAARPLRRSVARVLYDRAEGEALRRECAAVLLAQLNDDLEGFMRGDDHGGAGEQRELAGVGGPGETAGRTSADIENRQRRARRGGGAGRRRDRKP